MAQGNMVGYQVSPNNANFEYVTDGANVWLKVYNNSTALTDGRPYFVGTYVDATDTSNPIIYPVLGAPATNATETNIIGIVDNGVFGTSGIAASTWGYVCLKGYCSAYVDGTTDVVIGDGLEILNAGVALTQKSSASSGVLTTVLPEVCAIALEAYTSATAALKKVVLLGKQVQVD